MKRFNWGKIIINLYNNILQRVAFMRGIRYTQVVRVKMIHFQCSDNQFIRCKRALNEVM